MMGDSNDLAALEQRRLELEENILKLRKSLCHWITWEAEYDGLRDEISELNRDATPEECLAVGREFGGSLLNAAEVQNIVVGQRVTRTRAQIVDLLGRRIDYVKENVASVEKRLRAAEHELSVLGVMDQDSEDGTASFPVREILEELDEEGNVVSSSVNVPGDQASELLEALKKAGVEDIPENKTTKEPSTEASATAKAQNNQPLPEATRENEAGNDQPPQPDQSDQSDRFETGEEIEIDLKKPISLVTAEDRKVRAVTDVDESAEDAKLRREMIEYGIDEVGAIVAELEMDEEGSEFSVDEDDSDASEDEKEDEFGRSHTFLSEDYHQQMRELEAKLNARGMLNMGKDTKVFPEDVRQDIEQSAPNETQPEVDASDSAKNKKPKKRVAFAEELAIAPASMPSVIPTAEKRTLPPQSDIPVLSESVVERTNRTPESRQAHNEPKKVSRFKSARSTASTNEPVDQSSTQPISNTSNPSESQPIRKQTNAIPSRTPPELFPAKPQNPKPFSTPITDTPTSTHRRRNSKTLSDFLVEREVDPNVAPPEPDELDEETLRREIATEWFKAENRRVLKEDGFTGEQETLPLDPDDQPRISKFKAARMRRS